MNYQVLSHQTEGYLINTPVYEGPLDLLLDLIERAELDITRLSLSLVTDQYLAYIQCIQDRDPTSVSAFLVVAANLVQMKSEALLPHPPAREDSQEDPGETLTQQLIIYKRIKRAAGWLMNREAANYHTYLRLAPPPKIDEKVDLSGLTLGDILAAARRIFFQENNRPYLSTVVTIPLVTIKNKIRSILQAIQNRGRITFSLMLGENQNRVEIVVTFLAMLELIKRHILIADQPSLFSEIELIPLEPVNSIDEIDLDVSE